MKDKIVNWLKANLGICIGAIVGIVIFALGFVNFIALICVVLFCMLIGYMLQNNKSNIKESIKSFIDKF
ncbi:MAG: hypothetical protein PHH22_04055 [Clostridia bacterium]|nr:hypothetical protein [Clostridia bacterium]